MTTPSFDALAALVGAGRRFVLCTVVGASGSAPQRPGARMACLGAGMAHGTVGGGAFERRVQEEAARLLATGGTRLLELNLVRDLGMCCGGSMTVFLETIEPPAPLYVFGAGHVARPLAALAVEVAFAVTVVDEREEWLDPQRFPRAQRVLEDPAAFARRHAGDPRACYAILTHDHALDVETALGLAGKPRRWLGLIGSARKALVARERLAARGVAEAELLALRSPMGLPIGARTPEEIAVSIIAELVQLRSSLAAQGNGGGPA